MSTPPANTATPQPASEDVSAVMSAIQRLLADHNMGQARFILELPNNPAKAPAATAIAATNKGSSSSDNNNTDGETPKPLPCAAPRGSVTAAPPSAPSAVMRMDVATTTPADALPALPSTHRPPPRARSASAEPVQPHIFPSSPTPASATPPATQVSPEDSATQLNSTARPVETAEPSRLAETRGHFSSHKEGGAPSLMSPLQYSLRSSVTRAHTEASPHAEQSSLTSNPEESATAPPRPSVELTGELAELRRLSRDVAREVSSVEGRVLTTEPLHAFVGRSAILEDRRKRQSTSLATSHWSPSNGLPLFPSPPPTVPSTASVSFSPTRSSAFQPPPSLLNIGTSAAAAATHASPTSRNTNTTNATSQVAIPTSSESATPSRAQPSQRRSVVLVSSPDRKPAHALGGSSVSTSQPRSTHTANAGVGNASGAVPLAGSLPSLVAVRKSAVPGRTPVFSILNKEGSRLLEGGSGSAAATPTMATMNTGSNSSVSVSNNNTSGGVGGGGGAGSGGGGMGSGGLPRPHTPSNVRSSSGSAFPLHNVRPTSVSLMSDDRHPPSPVFQPLVGTAAEEQACNRPSILVQSAPSQQQQQQQQQEQACTRLFSHLEAPVSADTAGATPPAPPQPSPPPPPSLWAEQSRENISRALQLQSLSRLSHTTDSLSKGTKPAASSCSAAGAAGDGEKVQGSAEKPRRLFNPALSSRETKAGDGRPPPTSPSSLSTTPCSSSPSTRSGTTAPTPTAPAAPAAAAAAVASSGLTPSPPHPLPSASTASRLSLREMLLEQQQLEDVNRRSLEEHAKVMQAAHTVRAGSTTATTSSPYGLHATSSSSSSFSTPPRPAQPPATVAATVHASTHTSAMSADEGSVTNTSTRQLSPSRTGSLTHAPALSRAAGSASGIHVMKFTLPHDTEARQSAVRQLCRSPSGNQHVDSKDRYRALLAHQKEDLSSKAEKEEAYKDLLARAVEYNRLPHQQ